MMKKIALIYMGGTFGCIGNPLSPMPATAFFPQLQKFLPTHFKIECIIAPSIKDSSACTAVDWLQLVQQMQQLQQDGFQHFVILHGTDTLSYACALTARLMAQSAYIVFTGSQFPLLNTEGTALDPSSDAQANLIFALESVMNIQHGVYLAFHNTLIHAATALKIHTTALAAFTEQSAAPQKQLSLPYAIQYHDVLKAESFNCISLMLQPIALDKQLQNLNALLIQPPHVLILQAFGTANFAINDAIIECLQQLQHKNCAVILSTQVPFGEIDQRYAVSSWVKYAKIFISNCAGYADLYAKAFKMYLQYDCIEQWHRHWYDE